VDPERLLPLVQRDRYIRNGKGFLVAARLLSGCQTGTRRQGSPLARPSRCSYSENQNQGVN
jgi:hypothetical protein